MKKGPHWFDLRVVVWVTILVVLGIPVLAVSAGSRLITSDALPRRLADGFDFPVGDGDATGYYRARGLTPFKHLGDDWNGVGGGNSDLGDPILAIADGIVVYSYDYGSNWGEVIIVRHRYLNREGEVECVDSLYGHVQNRRVMVGDELRRGDWIADIGNNRGMYKAHLHLEIRKNIDIGIKAWNYSKGLSNYHRPADFIVRHRPGMVGQPGMGLMLALSRNAQNAGVEPAIEEEPAELLDTSEGPAVTLASAGRRSGAKRATVKSSPREVEARATVGRAVNPGQVAKSTSKPAAGGTETKSKKRGLFAAKPNRSVRSSRMTRGSLGKL